MIVAPWFCLAGEGSEEVMQDIKPGCKGFSWYSLGVGGRDMQLGECH